LGEIDAGLPDAVARGLAAAAAWPAGLPQSTIHADLFPDNVLMLDGRVTGLIDFYFACTDARAYDVAITHAAWCFSADGRQFFPGQGGHVGITSRQKRPAHLGDIGPQRADPPPVGNHRVELGLADGPLANRLVVRQNRPVLQFGRQPGVLVDQIGQLAFEFVITDGGDH
jgi:hypothetical protein